MTIFAKDIKMSASKNGDLKIFIKSLFFLVKVFQDQRKMISYINKRSIKISSDAEGIFCPTFKWVNKGSLKLTKCLGEIYFNKESINFSIVWHECIHAAFAYIRRIICKNRTMKEETLINREKEELICHLASIFAILIIDTLSVRNEEIYERTIK